MTCVGRWGSLAAIVWVAGCGRFSFETARDAGQDPDATARARGYFTEYAPSSPQIALLKDGKVVFMLERKNIEGRNARDIAADLIAAFDRFC